MTTNLGSGHSTAENPGDVHPTTDPNSGLHKPKEQGPSIFHSIENPYALREALNKLESSLDEIISMFESEGSTLAKDGSFSTGKEGCVWARERVAAMIAC